MSVQKEIPVVRIVRQSLLESVGNMVVRKGKHLVEASFGWLLLSPTLAVFVVFTYVPMAFLFVMALFHWNITFSHSQFVGLGEFKILFRQPLFWRSMLTTAYFAFLMVPAQTFLSLGIAMLFREAARSKLRGFFRSLVFLPHVTPLVATSIVWVWVFNPRFGLANFILSWFHIPPLNWLESTNWALPAVMIYSTWHSLGLYVILFLAGLANISRHPLEAAMVDGAGRGTIFHKIIWPLVSPSTFLVVLFATMNALQAFSQIYTMTGGPRGGGGGPAYATTTDALLIYQTGFQYYHYGLAAAMSIILFFVILGLTVFQKWISNRLVFYR
ncbi:carbohydrate ABC transporter permease [Alicyclobacillus sp. SO9]|uniref:carbohydrate ABC transporter permease n=1 Tax=Alicyclobacillus sp. SO9 TaxID=2665646 RepID=UPI0018E85274|nr:sugar ABC transporter permease [Alicyclobacillus sp. SO9]QQE80040.1 sugar ABC transporter permease [Alicyclobacillus sp. SO9]